MSADQAEHLDVVVARLMEAIGGATRRWSPHSLRLVRAEFRRRLLKAIRSDLTPVDEVKPLSDGRAALFEIRWTSIPVTDIDSAGALRYTTAEVRLIHTETVRLGLAAVGLHAHEKVVVPGDPAATRAQQDAEIAVAERVYSVTIIRGWSPPASATDEGADEV